MGLKDFCVLLLAGGMGAGSVVTVQAVKAPSHREARAPKAKPKPRRVAAQPRPRLPDCPVVVAPLGHGLLPDLAGIEPLGRPTMLPRPPIDQVTSIGPGPTLPSPILPILDRPLPPPPPPPGTVPEPATWGMMVSGFGLIGLALRGRARAAATTA